VLVKDVDRVLALCRRNGVNLSRDGGKGDAGGGTGGKGGDGGGTYSIGFVSDVEGFSSSQ
jgi:hypothetical protein